MKIYIITDNLYKGGYGAEIYITYATKYENRAREYALKHCSAYQKRQIELGYSKVEDLYHTIELEKECEEYVGGYIE